MNDITEKSFGLNLRIMKAIGFYPSKNNHFHKLTMYVILCLLEIPVPVLGSIHFIMEKSILMPYAGITATILAEEIFGLLKFLPFINKTDKMIRCIDYFGTSDFIYLINDNQKLILEDGIKICRKNTKNYLIFVIFSFSIWAISPFFDKDYRQPVNLWLPCKLVDGSLMFYCVYLLIVIGVCYLVIGCAVIDPLVGSLACLAASWLSVLKDNLQHLNEYAEEEIVKMNNVLSEENVLKSAIIYNKIKECVKSHNFVLEFVKLYEECFSPVIFSQMVGSTLIICFCCLQLSLVEAWTFDFFSAIGYTVCVLCQLYLYCHYGTILYDESNTLTDAIYRGVWYEYDIKSRKSLITLMERSKKPIVITAGKIIDSSLPTFTMIIRRSYSLLAVLKSQ